MSHVMRKSVYAICKQQKYRLSFQFSEVYEKCIESIKKKSSFRWGSSNLSCLMTKPTKWHPPSLISLRCALNGWLRTKFSSCGQRRFWSNWADDQADLSLLWAHMPFCWFCHEVAHFMAHFRELPEDVREVSHVCLQCHNQNSKTLAGSWSWAGWFQSYLVTNLWR